MREIFAIHMAVTSSTVVICCVNEEFCHTLKDFRKLAETGLLISPFSFNIRKAPDNLTGFQ